MQQFIFFFKAALLRTQEKNCMYPSMRCYSNICYESCKFLCFQYLSTSIQIFFFYRISMFILVIFLCFKISFLLFFNFQRNIFMLNLVLLSISHSVILFFNFQAHFFFFFWKWDVRSKNLFSYTSKKRKIGSIFALIPNSLYIAFLSISCVC